MSSFLKNKVFDKIVCNKKTFPVQQQIMQLYSQSSPTIHTKIKFGELHGQDPLFDCCCCSYNENFSYDLNDDSAEVLGNIKKKNKKKRKQRCSSSSLSNRSDKTITNKKVSSSESSSKQRQQQQDGKFLSKSNNDLNNLKCLNTNKLDKLMLDNKILNNKLKDKRNSYKNIFDEFENTVATSAITEWPCSSPITLEATRAASAMMMTPRIEKMYSIISDHDKKILTRMAMKRTEQILYNDEAEIARQYWDEEKQLRDLMISEHKLEFRNAVKEKRQQESLNTKNRLKNLASKQKYYLDNIRKEISLKNSKLINRLKNLEFKRDLKICDTKQKEYDKFATATINQHEYQLDEELRRQECYSHLENKIYRAELQRNYLLNIYRQRLLNTNELQQTSHSINYNRIKENEYRKLEKLREEIRERDRKYQYFVQQRQSYLNESRNQAKATAVLRNIVRRSISPDNYKGRYSYDRPFSNMSYDSYLNQFID